MNGTPGRSSDPEMASIKESREMRRLKEDLSVEELDTLKRDLIRHEMVKALLRHDERPMVNVDGESFLVTWPEQGCRGGSLAEGVFGHKQADSEGPENISLCVAAMILSSVGCSRLATPLSAISPSDGQNASPSSRARHLSHSVRDLHPTLPASQRRQGLDARPPPRATQSLAPSSWSCACQQPSRNRELENKKWHSRCARC